VNRRDAEKRRIRAAAYAALSNGEWAEFRRLKAESAALKESETPAKPNVAPQRLADFLIETANGRLTEPELKVLAEQKFPDKHIPDDTWREAFRQVPKDRKLPPGRPRRT
jgi:hypothetical protein